MKTLYVLRLISNKIYIGSTNNIGNTLKQCFSKNIQKDKYLHIYKPIYVDKILYNCNSDDEYNVLITYIKKYGVDNVRGSLFDSLIFEEESIKETIKDLNS